MKKRGQITVWIIIGMVLLLTVVLLFYLSSKGQTKPSIETVSTFQGETNSLNMFITSCLEKTLLNAIDDVGLKEPAIKDYIESNIDKCIDFTIFEEKGLKVTPEALSANISKTDNTIIADLNYPIDIEKEGQHSRLTNFNSKVSLIKSFEIARDAGGFVREQVGISLQDTTLVIPKGTKALDKNGNPLNTGTIRIIESSSPVIGFFKYDFKPDGASFEPAITLTTRYKDSDLPPGFHEHELEVKQFTEQGWESLPTNIDVVNNILITEIEHFSEFAPAIASEDNQQKQAFLISDKDWKNVFQLVPLAIYTKDGELHKTPMLIFHEEANSFDADSIIHFLQQYKTEKVTLVGPTPAEFDNLLVADKDLGAGLSQNQIQRIDPSIIIKYWSSYDKVVYVENDYKMAMIASVYASAINAPLIIQDGILDRIEHFRDKEVIQVGNVNCPLDSICNEKYETLESLQKKYIEVTGTDKIIIVNPNDVNVYIQEVGKNAQENIIASPFNTDLGGSISEVFNSMSLSAPLLAAGKREVIIFQDEITKGIFTDASIPNLNLFMTSKALEIRDSLLRKIYFLFPSNNAEYLTIVADPNNIPASVWYSTMPNGGENRYAVDRFYANDCTFPHGRALLDGSKMVGCADRSPRLELKTGRIYGISDADTSAYIMRSLFYDEIWSNTYSENELTAIIWNDYVVSNRGSDHDIFVSTLTKSTFENAKNAGYTLECLTSKTKPELAPLWTSAGCKFSDLDRNSLKRKQYITYFGHGSSFSWGPPMDLFAGNNFPKLDLPFAITWACFTNSFGDAYGGQFANIPHLPQTSKTLAMNFLRKGGMAYVGFVVGGHDYLDRCPECEFTSNDRALFYLSQSLSLGQVVMNLHHDYDYFVQDVQQYQKQGTRLGFNKALFLGDPTLTLKGGKKPAEGDTWVWSALPKFRPLNQKKDKKWWEFWK
ncbi:hypothetical protein KY330_02455 [Candidatus Woesearchaeota archaeon]|nr:hypothetical protein [Candidatus Woesearchaeota archaeon]